LFGPDAFSLAAHVERGGTVEEVARACADAGTRVYEIAALMVGAEEGAESGAREIAEYAAVLQPDWILTNVVAPVDDRVRDEFARCAEIIGESGARLAVEYLPWTPVATAGAALDLVHSVPGTGARVLPDVWHHFRGTDDWAALDAIPLDAIAYVQFSDALPMASDDIVDETVSRRVFPGDGEFDLATYCERMRAKGFDGVVSVEVLNAELRDMELADFTRRAYTATSRFWPGS
jgi:sugar phosphate isomerase/epimerase